MRKNRNVGLGRELARSIERDRLQRTEVLVEHLVVSLTENRGATGEEQPLYSVRFHRFQQGDCRQLIKLQVELKIRRAGGNVGVGGHVEDRIEMRFSKQCAQSSFVQ